MKKVWLLLLVLVAVLAMSQFAWAEDPVTGDDPDIVDDGTTGDVIDDGTTGDETDLTDITAALDTVNATVDGLAVTDAAKARLKETAAGRLQQAADRGFSAEQVQALADQMTQLFGTADLARDLPHINAACQFMIKAMRGGMAASDAYALLAGKLAAGEDLKTALKEARSELKGKGDKGNKNKNGKGNDNGDGDGNGNGNGDGNGNGNGHGNGHNK